MLFFRKGCQPEAAQPARQYIETTTISHPLGGIFVKSTLKTFIYDHVITLTREQEGVPRTCAVEMTSDKIPGLKPVVYVDTWTSKPIEVTCE